MLQSAKNKATLEILKKLRKQGAPANPQSSAEDSSEMPMKDIDSEFQAGSQLFPEEQPKGDSESDASPLELNPENDDSNPMSREKKRRLQRRKQQNLGKEYDRRGEGVTDNEDDNNTY